MGYAITQDLTAAMNWPFQEGRSQIVVLLIVFAGMLGICLAARFHFNGTCAAQFRFELVRFRHVWHSTITLVSIATFVLATTPNNVQAQVYNPVFYYHYGDQLGSSSVLIDRTGALVQHYEYGTFGNETYSNNSSAFALSERYTGQTLDEDTGLYYYGARYYDPELGRFIQPDTITPSLDSQSLNRYSYCENNPLNCVDPTGHELMTALIVGMVFGAIGGGIESAITGGDSAIGITAGAVAGLLAGAGIALGGSYAGALGLTTQEAATVGGALGGAAGGASSSAIGGGNPATGALIGAAIGAISGALDPDPAYTDEYGQTWTKTQSGIFVSNTGKIWNPNGSFGLSIHRGIGAGEASAIAGGTLGAITNIAGWVSVVPGPIGSVAGVINAVGEGLQGHWVAASVAVGGALLSGFGLGLVVKLGKLGREAKVAAKGPVVIGETMTRVEAAAAKIPGSKILNDMPDFRAMGMNADQVTSSMMQYNRRWMLDQMRGGRQIIDIGADANRASPSIFYQMEQNMLNNYQKLHPDFNGVVKP